MKVYEQGRCRDVCNGTGANSQSQSFHIKKETLKHKIGTGNDHVNAGQPALTITGSQLVA